MKQEGLFIILVLLLFIDVQAQSESSQDGDGPSFRPSIAVVVGILSIMFSITFLLLIYAKYCHTSASNRNLDEHRNNWLIRTTSRFSGIDKTVIESLPFFRFSSLKGSKEGLECAVCLSKFEDTEILRLLPKCKHAFHINCVDQWLESHSSCPICRYKVDPEDLTIFTNSNSLRFSRNLSELTNDPDLELFVRREEEDVGGSSRFSVGSSFRKMDDKGNNKEELLIQDDVDDKKLVHKIIASDVIFKNRWSDVSSTDLMFFNSQMLNIMSSKRFDNMLSETKRNEKLKEKRLFDTSNSVSGCSSSNLPSASDSITNLNDNSRLLVGLGKRSMSEITNHSRFEDLVLKNRMQESSLDGISASEERRKKLWFPIARRTVQWLDGRERRSKNKSQNSKQLSMV